MALQTKEFAVTGKSSSGGITYTYLLRVTENSISIGENTSNLTVEAILKQSYSGTAFSDWNTGVSCALNGEEIFSDYRKRRLDGKAEHIYYTWTGNVPHNADGSLTLSVGGSLWQSAYASYSPPAMTVAGEMTLTAIPRASTVTARDAVITGTSQVTVGRYATGFTHSIHWSFGSLSGYLAADGSLTDREAVYSTETVNFLIPDSFYSQIPDAPSGTCTLTCTTYHNGKAIGSSQCSFTVRAEESLCAPALTATMEDCNPVTIALTDDPETLVAGCSNALCAVSAQAKNGAKVVSVTAAGLPVEGGSRVIEGIATGSVEVCATDSRGFTTRKMVTLPLVPYVPLRCNPSVKRTDPVSGNAVLTLSGQCFRGSFGAEDNVLAITVEVGEQTIDLQPQVGVDNSYEATVSLSDLDYTCAHTVTVTATDCLDRVVKTVAVPKGVPVFDWGEKDFCFHVPASGTFLGSFQGVYLRTVYLYNTPTCQLQSRFTQFQSGATGRQSLFLFGSANGVAVYGVLIIYGMGNMVWTGTEGVTVSALSGGRVQVNLSRNAWDTFTFMSADPFEIL